MNIAAPYIENAETFTRACGWHKLLPNKIVDSGGATYKSGCSQEHPDLKKIIKKKKNLFLS